MGDSQLTFDEVIEEHRTLIQAERVRVSLVPKATPETLREELRKIRESVQQAIYARWNACQ